jgi:hypothetical protein
MRTEKLLGAIALIGATAAFNAGCVGRASAGAYAEVEAPVVFVEPPTLVLIDSGVWVVRDYEYSVYYYSDFYWVYRGGVWYRSHAYDRGWATVEVDVVPSFVVHRDHRAYVHYRGSARAQTRVAARGGGYTSPEPEPARKDGPPGHAAAQHGGPPGQQDPPGVGNQRKEETGEASSPKKKKHEEKKGQKKDKDKDKEKHGEGN